MDDLKVYPESWVELQHMVQEVERANNAIGMAFWLHKCAVASMVGRKPAAIWSIKSRAIEALGISNQYRYLGVEQQLFDTKLGTVNCLWMRVISCAQLSGRNTIVSTNSWVLSVTRYYMVSVKWSQGELLSLDCGFHWTKSHHNNSAVERYSLLRVDGGRCTTRVNKCIARREYLLQST